MTRLGTDSDEGAGFGIGDREEIPAGGPNGWETKTVWPSPPHRTCFAAFDVNCVTLTLLKRALTSCQKVVLSFLEGCACDGNTDDRVALLIISGRRQTAG